MPEHRNESSAAYKARYAASPSLRERIEARGLTIDGEPVHQRRTLMSKTATPTMLSAEQAAEALGLDVFDLARALRGFAVDELERVTTTVRRGDERPNLGRFQRLLRAAETCEAAWDELAATVAEDDGDDT